MMAGNNVQRPPLKGGMRENYKTSQQMYTALHMRPRTAMHCYTHKNTKLHPEPLIQILSQVLL